MNERRFMRAVVVQNQMHVQSVGDCCLDAVQEFAELDRAVPEVEIVYHASALHLQRREQRGGAVPYIVMRAPLGLPRTHRQQRLGTVQRLNLSLLVHAQHQSFVRRVQIQTDDIPHLFNEQRVLGKLKCLGAMRLESESTPDAADRALTESAAAGHRARRPVRGVGGTFSSVHVSTRSTAASLISRGAPGRGPSKLRATKRLRHLPTVGFAKCICCATSVFVFPCAQARMMRARKDKAWAELGRRTQRGSSLVP